MEEATGLTSDEEDLSQASRSTFDQPYKPEKNLFSDSEDSEDDKNHQDKSENVFRNRIDSEKVSNDGEGIGQEPVTKFTFWRVTSEDISRG